MATDTSKNADRLRSVLSTLLRQIPPTDRERILSDHVIDLQKSVDAVMEVIESTAPPSGSLRRARPLPAQRPTPVVKRVESTDATDAATVPGAIRAVLANEPQGLLPRAIIAGVEILRPNTLDHSVTSALHTMLKRGELAREGLHKNYRYILVTNPSNGADLDAPRGGETH